MKKTASTLLSGLVLTLSGCVLFPPGPGKEPADQPPQIVESKDDTTKRLWDNPQAFGQVPPELQAKGDATCQYSGFEEATGYHPKAKDYDGNVFPGGGFFCVGDKNTTYSSYQGR